MFIRLDSIMYTEQFPCWVDKAELYPGSAAAAGKSLQSCPTLCDPILLANLKTTGQPRRVETQGRVDMAARVQSHLEAESPVPWRIQCFSFKAFS